ncbi:hypothetical protein BDR07DRAFT_541526 [Suillus spraguei]|nr:hypothetical protein BDR07DRAFT_541526 [Suillus spraguei]
MIISIAESGCRDWAAAGRVCARGVGAEPNVFPPPGNDEPLVPALLSPLSRVGCAVLLGEPEVDTPESSTPDSIIRAFSGSSCSERKLTSRPWIRSTDFSRSIHAWCAFSMSSPRRRSTSRPSSSCEPHGWGRYIGKEGRLTSIIVNEHGRCKSARRICALCTRPRIFAVPLHVQSLQIDHQRDALSCDTSVLSNGKENCTPACFCTFGAHCTSQVKSGRHEGGARRTDCLLRSAIYKCLYRMRVHLHRHATVYQHF